MDTIKHSKPSIGKEDIKAVAEQVELGMHAAGKKTEEFESEICKLIGTKYAKAVNSGTNALHLALLALGIKKGDEVILPSYVCQAVLNSVNYTGATPILADIDEDSFNISKNTIKPLITDKTKAIIVPHMFGIPADMDSIMDLRIPVIEDCAQAIGAEYNGKKLGCLGDIGIFSFYATKIISTGHGGMIVTNSSKIAEKIDDLTKYDQREKYSVAYNFSFTDIQSALGLSQLKKLFSFLKKRKQIAERYDVAFKDKFKIVDFPKGAFPYRYLIQLSNKEEKEKLMEELKEKNIGVDNPVFKPLHQYLNLSPSNFKNTELAQNTVLSIPLYPALTEEEIDYVISKTMEFE